MESGNFFIGRYGMKKAFEFLFFEIGSDIFYCNTIVTESIVFYVDHVRYKFERFRDGDCFLYVNGVVDKSFRLDNVKESKEEQNENDVIPFENEENCNVECEKCICRSCVKRCEICIDCSSHPFAVRKSECEKKVGV